MLWAEWSVQSLPTKPEDFAPEHMPNLSFGRIPEPIARLEKLASSFFERKPGVLIVRGLGSIKKRWMWALRAVTSDGEQHWRRPGVLWQTANMGPKAAMDERRVR